MDGIDTFYKLLQWCSFLFGFLQKSNEVSVYYIYMLSTAVPSFQPIFVKGFFVNLRYAFCHIQPPTGVVSHSLKTNAIIVITSILNFYCHSNLQVAGF